MAAMAAMASLCFCILRTTFLSARCIRYYYFTVIKIKFSGGSCFCHNLPIRPKTVPQHHSRESPPTLFWHLRPKSLMLEQTSDVSRVDKSFFPPSCFKLSAEPCHWGRISDSRCLFSHPPRQLGRDGDTSRMSEPELGTCRGGDRDGSLDFA